MVKQDNDGISHHYHFFGQDEWRLSPQLTLSYGVRYELHPGYYDKYGDIGNFDPSVALSGRVIYPQGKQALLAQGFLASANACDPDGVNNTNSATVNGAPCMQVQGNDTAGYPVGLKKYPHLRFMPRLGFAYRPFGNDKWAIRGGMRHLQHQHARFQLLLAHRHRAGPDPAVRQHLQPRHPRHRVPVAANLCRLGRRSWSSAVTAPTTSAPPTAPTGKTLTPNSGR